MSDAADRRIAELEQELRASQELLFLVLDAQSEPVHLNIEEARAAITGDRMIDLSMNDDETEWVLQVVKLA